MRRRSRCRHAASLAAALAAVGLTGCGGGSTTLSLRDLRNRATYLCSTASRLTDRVPTPISPAAGATFLQRGASILGPELTELRTLRPPSDVADVYSTAVGALSEEVHLLIHVVGRLHGGADPVIEIKGLQQRLVPLEDQADGAWGALQIPACVDQ